MSQENVELIRRQIEALNGETGKGPSRESILGSSGSWRESIRRRALLAAWRSCAPTVRIGGRWVVVDLEAARTNGRSG
jgi:hypothetical protein